MSEHKLPMGKAGKIIYWIATGWLSLGMVSTGIVQLIKMPEEADRFTDLGYPVYLMTLLGIWKLLGAIAVLSPNLSTLKQWAYAGFFFTMTGAIYSHLSVGHPISELFPALLLLVLTFVSWHFLPVRTAPKQS